MISCGFKATAPISYTTVRCPPVSAFIVQQTVYKQRQNFPSPAPPQQLNAVCPEKGCKRSNFDMTAAEVADAREALKVLKKRWGQRDAEARREEEQAQQRQTVLADTVSSDGLLPQRDQLVAPVEHIARVGGASDAPAQVARYLADVLTMHEGHTQPADEEAVRFILGFASSLKDPDLGQAPSLQDCPTLCTLVPHYNVSFQAVAL